MSIQAVIKIYKGLYEHFWPFYFLSFVHFFSFFIFPHTLITRTYLMNATQQAVESEGWEWFDCFLWLLLLLLFSRMSLKDSHHK